MCRHSKNSRDQFDLDASVVRVLAHKTGSFSQKKQETGKLKVAKSREFPKPGSGLSNSNFVPLLFKKQREKEISLENSFVKCLPINLFCKNGGQFIKIHQKRAKYRQYCSATASI